MSSFFILDRLIVVYDLLRRQLALDYIPTWTLHRALHGLRSAQSHWPSLAVHGGWLRGLLLRMLSRFHFCGVDFPAQLGKDKGPTGAQSPV